MFNVQTQYEKYENCVLSVGRYANNNHIALFVMSDKGPVAVLTVNIDRIENFPEDCSCIDTNNFPEGMDLIEELGIGEPCGALASGFCIYPIYKFNLEKIKNYME